MQATTNNRDANRVQEVSEISRGLKALARELSVPVIALSQLSRQPEMRESKEPRLSDLRESGAIEQDADLVMFLWRDKERGADDPDQEGEVINLKLAKHRNGPTGEIQLYFKKRQTRFVSYAGERYADVPAEQPATRLVRQQRPEPERKILPSAAGKAMDWAPPAMSADLERRDLVGGHRPVRELASARRVHIGLEVGHLQVRPRPGNRLRGRYGCRDSQDSVQPGSGCHTPSNRTACGC